MFCLFAFARKYRFSNFLHYGCPVLRANGNLRGDYRTVSPPRLPYLAIGGDEWLYGGRLVIGNIFGCEISPLLVRYVGVL